MIKPAVPIVTFWTDYQLVPLLWVRHRHNSSITIFCFNANNEKRFFVLFPVKAMTKKTAGTKLSGFFCRMAMQASYPTYRINVVCQSRRPDKRSAIRRSKNEDYACWFISSLKVVAFSVTFALARTASTACSSRATLRMLSISSLFLL